MNIAMIAVHLPAPSHHHDVHVAMPGQQSTLMDVATAVAAVEVALAMAVLYYRTRGNAQLVNGKPAR
jgi:NADH:ubiquinone oxidoreductase subunit K